MTRSSVVGGAGTTITAAVAVHMPVCLICAHPILRLLEKFLIIPRDTFPDFASLVRVCDFQSYKDFHMQFVGQ